MSNFYCQVKRILQVALIGLLNKPEAEFVPRKHILSNDSYEEIPIVYRARPIGQGHDTPE